MSSTETVVVAGGAGFIGAHLCTRLVGEGHTVICVDDFSSGSEAAVGHLLNHDNFTLIEHDVLEPLDEVLAGTGVLQVTQIYNLACPASPPHYQKDPVRTTRICVEGTLNLLNLARTANARLLLTSTSEVYGDPLSNPQKETDRGNVNPVGIRACYDEGKRVAESLCFDYHRQYGTDITVARLFNTYGPGMLADDGRLIPNLVAQALRGEALTVYGDGNQTRAFCYIDDTLDGLIRLMNSGHAGPVNLGNPVEHTVLEMADLIREMTGTNVPITHLPLPEDDPRQRLPDITRAGELLNWSPEVALEQGLRATVDHFIEALKLPMVAGDA